MNKIRVIDLLNKIANGEEVPKKIRLDNEIYEFNKWGNDYKLNSASYQWWLFQDYCFGSNGSRLNYKVEIIEEDEKIEKFMMTYPMANNFNSTIGGLVSIYNTNFAHLKKTIDEVIDIVNELNNNK